MRKKADFLLNATKNEGSSEGKREFSSKWLVSVNEKSYSTDI